MELFCGAGLAGLGTSPRHLHALYLYPNILFDVPRGRKYAGNPYNLNRAGLYAYVGRSMAPSWFDSWMPTGPLYLTHAALFSHTTTPNLSVQHVFRTNFELCLRPRLTDAASAELASLLPCLQDVLPDDAPDQWTHDINREALHHKGRV